MYEGIDENLHVSGSVARMAAMALRGCRVEIFQASPDVLADLPNTSQPTQDTATETESGFNAAF